MLNYDEVTGVIGCKQEAYIDRLLVKYGMTNANACKLPWFLSVCYTYDEVTSVIGCKQEAYIDRLLVKYGMTNANVCKLPLYPGSTLTRCLSQTCSTLFLCMPTLL